MPRHPPCALTHLTTTRCSHPLCNTQHTTTPQTTDTTTHHTPKRNCVRRPEPGAAPRTTPTTGVSSGPNSVPSPPPATTDRNMFEPSSRSVPPSHTHSTPHNQAARCLIRRGISERRTHPTSHPPHQQPTPDRTHHQTVRLLRKEVIQPHLPVRLPCYDFVPIASPTFDDSPPASWVRPSASGVTNFRDVTGGVYKARERIHRSVADLRLLATPTSRGRVADPDPN